ncbi:hypothetical protein Nham_1960 [Nitrobacter hamburgensis X14]|uniref:Uncharacterized protein n=1 Tax=Nitrobacter hamburgensis (strain DSM 10229 / NCIMB 13809 / X14) TaxID=323097 RepID=Q1QLY5_NITHX|nr:hypothetical protein Nham_1960 [Nitrobacter hamburgensis X14]
MPSDYPMPTFPSQKQPMPGSTEKMEPRPDHGEETYKGSGKLESMRAIVTGGARSLTRSSSHPRHQSRWRSQSPPAKSRRTRHSMTAVTANANMAMIRS